MQTPEEGARVEMEWLVLPSGPESFEEFRTFVLSRARSGGVRPTRIQLLELVLEEILINVISYAYDGSAGVIRVGCGTDSTRFMICFRDDGKYFNLLDRKEPDLNAGVEDRPVGGLGIHLVKTMVDHISYRRIGHSNELEVGFAL